MAGKGTGRVLAGGLAVLVGGAGLFTVAVTGSPCSWAPAPTPRRHLPRTAGTAAGRARRRVAVLDTGPRIATLDAEQTGTPGRSSRSRPGCPAARGLDAGSTRRAAIIGIMTAMQESYTAEPRATATWPALTPSGCSSSAPRGGRAPSGGRRPGRRRMFYTGGHGGQSGPVRHPRWADDAALGGRPGRPGERLPDGLREVGADGGGRRRGAARRPAAARRSRRRRGRSRPQPRSPSPSPAATLAGAGPATRPRPPVDQGLGAAAAAPARSRRRPRSAGGCTRSCTTGGCTPGRTWEPHRGRRCTPLHAARSRPPGPTTATGTRSWSSTAAASRRPTTTSRRSSCPRAPGSARASSSGGSAAPACRRAPHLHFEIRMQRAARRPRAVHAGPRGRL